MKKQISDLLKVALVVLLVCVVSASALSFVGGIQFSTVSVSLDTGFGKDNDTQVEEKIYVENVGTIERLSFDTPWYLIGKRKLEINIIEFENDHISESDLNELVKVMDKHNMESIETEDDFDNQRTKIFISSINPSQYIMIAVDNNTLHDDWNGLSCHGYNFKIESCEYKGKSELIEKQFSEIIKKYVK